jgi:hypothetical protein
MDSARRRLTLPVTLAALLAATLAPGAPDQGRVAHGSFDEGQGRVARDVTGHGHALHFDSKQWVGYVHAPGPTDDRPFTPDATARTWLHPEVETQDEATRLVLRNERVTVVLSKAAQGAVTSVTDNATGQEFIAKQAAPCLFRLVFTKAGDVSGKTETFASGSAQDVAGSVRKTDKGSVAKLEFRGIGGRKIDATCTVSVQPGDALVRWRIAVRGAEPLVLEEVHFPVFVLPARLGDRDDDDAVVTGNNRGGIFRRPGRWHRGARLSDTQPGSLTAQFACCYDATAGFYTATQDAKGYRKMLEMVRTSDGLELAWKHLCFHETAEPLALDYDVTSTTFHSNDRRVATDWRDGADIYRAWALRQPWCARTIAERHDLPDLVKRGAALLFCDVRSRWGNAASMASTAGWIERYWRQHFGAAPPPVAVFFGCEGLAAWASPEYFPLYPSDAEFVAGARALHKVGANVYLALSSYQWWLSYGKRPGGGFLWDGRAEFEKTARTRAAAGRDGAPYHLAWDWLEGGETAQLCHGDRWTREWFAQLAEELHKRGADMFHFDQTIGGNWLRRACYSRSHSHPPGRGLWEVGAVHEQFRSLRQTLPEFFIAGFEEPQELFIQGCCLQFYDGFSPWTVARQPGHEPAPVIEHVYHEFFPLYAATGGAPDQPEIMADSLVNGNFLQYQPSMHGLPGTPLLPNGGFEEWSGDGVPVDWQNMKMGMRQIWQYTGQVSRDAHEKHGGRFSLRLAGKDGGSAAVRHRICSPSKEMCLGKTYRIRVWLKSTAAVKDAVSIRITDRGNRSLGRWSIDIAQPMDWTEKQLVFTLGDNVRWADIVLGVAGQKATVWFDDFVLEETASAGKAQVAVWGETPQNRLFRQWVRLFSGVGRPYLLEGQMLRRPPLAAETIKCSVAQAWEAPHVLRRVPLHFSDAQGKIVGSAYLDIGASDVGWEKRDVTFTVPAGAKRGTLYLYLQGKGKLWFDDLELVEVGRNENLLPNGAFEEWNDTAGAPAGWDRSKSQLAYGVEQTGDPRRDPKDKHGGRFALNLANDEDGTWTGVSRTLPTAAGGLSVGKSYRLTLWLKAQGMSLWRRLPTRGEIPAILHNAYRAPDGSEAVVAVNITDKAQTGRLRWAGKEIELNLSAWEVKLVRVQ